MIDHPQHGHGAPRPELPGSQEVFVSPVHREFGAEDSLELSGHGPPPDPPIRRRKWGWPLLLYLASIASTFYAYYANNLPEKPADEVAADVFLMAVLYSGAIIFTLTAHELGHFVQALLYRVPADFPYFIPMPFGPLGTMGAVILMRGNIGHRRALFDIGISGPLAGLVPAILFTIVGIYWSDVAPPRPNEMFVGAPLLFTWLIHGIKGPLPPGQSLELHPLAYAGWVGFLITSLNLFPVGQLDGGHVLYAILRRKSYPVALFVVWGSILMMAFSGAYQWMPMALLLLMMGPLHPPTADDEEPLGAARVCLGIATLLFVIVGFTPTPFFN